MSDNDLDFEFRMALKAGQEFYKKCETIILQIAEQIEKNYVQFKTAHAPVLSVKQLLKRFDYGLQLTIYAAAASTNGKIVQNKISQLDIDFIRNIVFHGDIFTDKIFSISFPSMEVAVTWDNILEISGSLGIDDAIIRNMLKSVTPFIQEFMECATLCDQLELYEGKTFISQLQQQIAGFPTSRSLYTGFDNSDEEFKNFALWVTRFWKLEGKEHRILRKIYNHLNEAQEHYKKCGAIVAQMKLLLCISDDLRENGDMLLLSANELLKNFDYGLQFTLLKFAATIDGNPVCGRANELDVEFIKKIVREGDICADNIPKSSLSWDEITKCLTQKNAESIHKMLDDRIGQPVGEQLKKYFQLLDKIKEKGGLTSRGLLSQIEKEIEMILTIFSRLHDLDSCASYARNSDNNHVWLQKFWEGYH